MKFLAQSTNTADVNPYLEAEFARVEELRATGTIGDIWLKADLSGAVFVIEAADLADARDTPTDMPIARAGAARFALTGIVDLDAVQDGAGVIT